MKNKENSICRPITNGRVKSYAWYKFQQNRRHVRYILEVEKHHEEQHVDRITGSVKRV